jgi:molecular chaperone GrpE
MEETEENKHTTSGDERSEVKRLKEELRHEHEMYLRALADYDNYRKRVERERAAAARSGKRELLLSLLEVVDGFDRALEHAAKASPPVSEGLQALHRNFLGVLEKHGITPIAALGQTFNPELHDAIGLVPSNEHKSGVVVEELQRGYRWDGDVLRPARVRVAQ